MFFFGSRPSVDDIRVVDTHKEPGSGFRPDVHTYTIEAPPAVGLGAIIERCISKIHPIRLDAGIMSDQFSFSSASRDENQFIYIVRVPSTH